jgi:hypothetical protein
MKAHCECGGRESSESLSAPCRKTTARRGRPSTGNPIATHNGGGALSPIQQLGTDIAFGGSCTTRSGYGLAGVASSYTGAAGSNPAIGSTICMHHRQKAKATLLQRGLTNRVRSAKWSERGWSLRSYRLMVCIFQRKQTAACRVVRPGARDGKLDCQLIVGCFHPNRTGDKAINSARCGPQASRQSQGWEGRRSRRGMLQTRRLARWCLWQLGTPETIPGIFALARLFWTMAGSHTYRPVPLAADSPPLPASISRLFFLERNESR